MIVISAEHIEQLRTPAGAFNKAAMEIVGCWPLVSGWQQALIGRKIADRKWKAALKAAAQGKQHRFRGNTRSR